MGVRYICPICEHELKGIKKYCHHCRSFIKEPLPYTAAFLPNESECYRADIDYMDPRNLKKQQEHQLEHKKGMTDRPQVSVRRDGTPIKEANRRVVSDLLDRPGSSATQAKGLGYSYSKGAPAGSYRGTRTKEQSNQGSFLWKVILFFIFLMITGSC